MRERFQRVLTEVEELENRQVLFGVAVTALAIFLVTVHGSSSQQPAQQNDREKIETQFRVPVGEKAYGDPVKVNITDQVIPSEVRLSPNQTVVWHNRNGFNVTIRTGIVERDFLLGPGEKLIFRPFKSFSYTAYRGEVVIGTGKVKIG